MKVCGIRTSICHYLSYCQEILHFSHSVSIIGVNWKQNPVQNAIFSLLIGFIQKY